MSDEPHEALAEEIAALVAQRRWAALATLDAHARPEGAMVAYAVAAEAGEFLLHLSRLGAHTRNLLARPAAALVVGAPDLGGDDPQTLPRLSVQAEARPLAPGSAEHAAARACYLARLPAAEPRFGFADFVLLALVPLRATWVGDFARARSLSDARVREVLARCG